MSHEPNAQYVNLNGQLRRVIPCPDDKEGCEVLHTVIAEPAELLPPERIWWNIMRAGLNGPSMEYVRLDKISKLLDDEFNGILTAREVIGAVQNLVNWQSPDPKNTIELKGGA